MHHREPLVELPIISPDAEPDTIYSTASEAVADLQARYAAATGFLREHFRAVMGGEPAAGHYRAFYPSVSFTTASFAKVDPPLLRPCRRTGNL